MALNNSLSPTLTFLEITTTLLTATKTTISTTELATADSLFFQQRTRQVELHPPAKQKAKRQRLQVISHSNYQALSYKLREQVATSTHEFLMLVTMDQGLKVFRAQQRADTAVEIDDSYPPNPTHPPTVAAP
jgi:hypothetical protein